MTPSLEKVLAEIKTLTAAERRQLWDLLERDQPPDDLSLAASLVDKIKGKYAFVATSSEAFASRKAEEIELEDLPSDSP
jgi:hypothetical protein